MMFGYGSDWASWQVALVWIGMIAFSGLLLWAVYSLIAGATQRSDHEHRGGEARHILDQRLAKGEIDAEEYRRLRDLIAGRELTPASTGDRR